MPPAFDPNVNTCDDFSVFLDAHRRAQSRSPVGSAPWRWHELAGAYSAKQMQVHCQAVNYRDVELARVALHMLEQLAHYDSWFRNRIPRDVPAGKVAKAVRLVTDGKVNATIEDIEKRRAS